MTTHNDPVSLNAELNLWGANREIQFDKDKEAAREYFLSHVNPNTVFFHDQQERLGYLFDEGYYDRTIFDQYSSQFLNTIYGKAYDFKFRFRSFIGALKFYRSYALKTFDGKRYLERFEDRVVATALTLARGDEELAVDLVDAIITGAYQPATPTFLNAARADAGEMVSCFTGNTLVRTDKGYKEIRHLSLGDSVLTHDGTHQSVTEVHSRNYSGPMVTLDIAGNPGDISSTPEHPFLALPKGTDTISVISGDGAVGGLSWVPSKSLQAGDFVAVTYPQGVTHKSLMVSDYIDMSGLSIADGSIVRTVTHRPHLRESDVCKKVKKVTNDISLDYRFGLLVGYYLSEGYVHHSNGSIKGLRFTFNSKETSLIEDVTELGSDIFGVSSVTNVNKDGSTNVCLWSGVLGRFFLNLLGSGFDEKTLPSELQHAPDEFLRGVLVGSFRGDGRTTPTGVVMDMVNPSLIRQLRDAALRLHLLPFERRYINRAGNPTGSLRISALSVHELAFINEVDKDIWKFSGTLGKSTTVTARWSDNTALYRVNSVSHDLEIAEPVYNLEVETNHTYSIEGYTVHNCFLLDTRDSLESIMETISASAQLSKRGGGVAVNLSNLRGSGDPIKGVEGAGSGVIPYAKVLDDTSRWINQLGQRQGAFAGWIHAHHIDVLDLLDTKRENADEAVRLKTLSLGVVIPDITYQLAAKGEDMYLFSPYDVSKKYGKDFSDVDITEHYRELVEDPDVRKRRTDARKFFQTLAELRYESGYPYIMNVDTVNRASNVAGKVKMSNLCSEILQPQTPSVIDKNGVWQETGKDISCNLGSMNVARAMESGDLGKVVSTAVRSLSAVAEMTEIAVVPTIEKANRLNRSIGLGQMNLHGFFGKERMHYGDADSLEFTSAYFSTVAYYAYSTSLSLASETGEVFDGFEKSSYADGSAFDKYRTVDYRPKSDKVRAIFEKYGIEVPSPADWDELSGWIVKEGLYNSHLMAVAPTGSISYVSHSTSSIMPIPAKIEIRKEGHLGRVYAPAPEMDNDNTEFFEDAYEIGWQRIIDVYAAATEHVDQGLSLNLFFPHTSMKEAVRSIMYAHKQGIKTLYYQRVRQTALEGTDDGSCVSCAV